MKVTEPFLESSKNQSLRASM